MVRVWSVALVSALVGFSAPALATETDVAAKYATEFGKTLPPIGFVKFCASNPEECKKRSVTSGKVELTPDAWRKLFQVNASVNEQIKPVSDQELYGTPEHWTIPASAGDCEDFLLLKKRYLEAMGYSPSNLLITVVLDEKGEGHAVLTVVTNEGEFVLDNRRNDILAFTETNYTFLKRQSRQNPVQWVSLRKNKSAPSNVAVTNQ
jgi:predicted transglutaminase-like cysteine proteinase